MFLGQAADILRVFRRAKNDPIRGAAAPAINELPPAYAAEYPYNNVTATESGHLFELDDTPGAERVHVYHRTGSHIEMRPDGTVKYVSKSKRQDVTIADQEIIVNGDYKISVAGGANIYVRGGAFEIQADNGLAINVKGELKLRGDNIFMRADNKISLAAPKVDIGGVGKNASVPFLSLPTGIVPIFGVLVPRVTGIFPSSSPTVPSSINASALGPTSSITSIVTAVKGLATSVSSLSTLASTTAAYARDAGKSLAYAKGLMGSDGQPLVPEIAQPEEIPLSNPQVYNGKSVERIAFRDRQFDTPEDVDSGDTYVAHQNLSEELRDFESKLKDLPGQPSTVYVDTTAPEEEPPPRTAYVFSSGGTVRFESGNTIVIGTGTKFTEDVAVGMYLTFPSAPFQQQSFPSTFPRVASIANDTVLVLAAPYTFTTISNVSPYVFKYRPFQEYADRNVFTATERLGSSSLTLQSMLVNFLPPLIEPEEITIPKDAPIITTPLAAPNPATTGGESATTPIVAPNDPQVFV